MWIKTIIETGAHRARGNNNLVSSGLTRLISRNTRCLHVEATFTVFTRRVHFECRLGFWTVFFPPSKQSPAFSHFSPTQNQPADTSNGLELGNISQLSSCLDGCTAVRAVWTQRAAHRNKSRRRQAAHSDGFSISSMFNILILGASIFFPVCFCLCLSKWISGCMEVANFNLELQQRIKLIKRLSRFSIQNAIYYFCYLAAECLENTRIGFFSFFFFL